MQSRGVAVLRELCIAKFGPSQSRPGEITHFHRSSSEVMWAPNEFLGCPKCTAALSFELTRTQEVIYYFL